MTDSRRQHRPVRHDELTEATSMLMTMVERVIHDGEEPGCPGCSEHGSTHGGGEALAA